MSPRRRILLSSALIITALLAGCASAQTPPPATTTPTVSPAAPSASASHPADETGVLTENAVAEVAPSWAPSRFRAPVGAPDGHAYGGDCRGSAWDVLYLTEAATYAGQTFVASGAGVPAPALTIAVLELSPTDRQRDLDALVHQFTSCVGKGPDGSSRQEAVTSVEDWSGLHQVAENRDLYWAAYGEGIVVAQLTPALDSLDPTTAAEARGVLALQLTSLP